MAKIADPKQEKAVSQFCTDNKLILFSDIQSSQSSAPNNLAYYDLALINASFNRLLQQADIIIQFGEQLVSKCLATFIDAFEGELQQVSPGETRIDPHHKLDTRFNHTAMQWIDVQIIKASNVNNNWSNAQ